MVQTTKGQATKRPWHIDGFDLTNIIVKHPSGNGWIKVADCHGEFPIDEQIANAQLIVRAVNSHDELVEALKEAHAMLENVGIEKGQYYGKAINKVEQALSRAEAS